MSRGRNWTNEELEYLENQWGMKSIPAIAKNLNRSVWAIKNKVQEIGLSSFLQSGDYLTLNQLLIAVTGSENSYSYRIESWVKRRKLPVHTKKVDKCSFKVVFIDEFWEWAEKNRDFLDFSKMEPLILGIEPKWVEEQRKNDILRNRKIKTTPWTKAEDNKLKYLLDKKIYGYSEISERLNRSCGAIQRRCVDLEIKSRPVRAENHGESAKWTEDKWNAVVTGIKDGECYAVIGERIGKSEKAVRGKVYSVYHTEKLDKVRERIEICYS